MVLFSFEGKEEKPEFRMRITNRDRQCCEMLCRAQWLGTEPLVGAQRMLGRNASEIPLLQMSASVLAFQMVLSVSQLETLGILHNFVVVVCLLCGWVVC